MNRRTFIHTSLATAAISRLLASCKTKKKIPGRIIGASAATGHLLRDGFNGPVLSNTQKKAVIIGAGISGLSAARQLMKNNMTDFILLDLEGHAGGNASYGKNKVSAYPLGAHYIPTPNNDLVEYLGFLQECNVITGFNDKGLPIYNEFYLCFDSQERLFINGKWQDGLVPQYGIPADELKQTERFIALMETFRQQKGSDNKYAFAIPVDHSSKDDAFVKLDSITMKAWMIQNGFTSAYLQWYINYCTRDDFGTPFEKSSAWAGIHYFAGRKGNGANASHGDVITWPEGNGFLVNALQKGFTEKIKINSLALDIQHTDNGVRIEYMDVKNKTVHAIEADQCILAVPQFVAARLLKNEERKKVVADHYQYVPWLVANLQVTELKELNGIESSWDNVIYNSKSLGYVDATHQLLNQKTAVRNITYYLPLTDTDCTTARRAAQHKSYEQWIEIIIADLEKVHAGIRDSIKEANIMLWGHAMAQTLPGMIFGSHRKSLQISLAECIHFANTDIAGISIFEEGFYQGLKAADKVLEHVFKS